MDFSERLPVTPLFVPTWSRYSAAWDTALSGGPATSAPTANLALYTPLLLPWPYPMKRMFWANGSSVAGNIDIGLFTPSGAPIFRSGAVAQAGVSTLQYVTADMLLSPGSYYLAIAPSSAAARLMMASTSTVARARLAGLLQQAAAHPLPGSMTPASVTAGSIPLLGITRTASGF